MEDDLLGLNKSLIPDHGFGIASQLHIALAASVS